MILLAWITLLAPLVAAVVLTLNPGLRRSEAGPKLAIFSVAICAVSSFVFWAFKVENFEHLYTWMSFEWLGNPFAIEFGVKVDELSKLMLLVVGFVGTPIFIFAKGYMKGDPSIGRFYAKFALFVFSMLGIVFATNFLMIFVFWELVGASSYLLIGYYYEKPSACEAAKKAFLTNRVADFGFLLGILLIWDITGSFRFDEIRTAIETGAITGASWKLSLAGVLVFVGAMGKSAQVPFHVWLPDAMEGPTPVSALMHAATMVAAGVYMVIRAFYCFGAEFGMASNFIVMTGAVTAVLAATIALVQNDIKKVLAYSTLSQLGYMVMALGAGYYAVAMFHLTTHAFFKGLLFLCAGSVIHGCHHEQDMMHMGGLRKKMPTTFWCFTIGMAALTGIPFLSGFFSKDLIVDALHKNHFTGIQLVATATAGLTALYMARSWFLTFFGEYRGHATPHESPKVMTRPLQFLAFFSAFLGLYFYYAGGQGYLAAWQGGGKLEIEASIAIVSTAVVAVGYFLAWSIYGKGTMDKAAALKQRFAPVHSLLENKYYIDDFYLWLVKSVQQAVARGCRFVEERLIVGVLVGWPTAFTRWSGDKLRGLQVGRLNFYAYCFVGGVTLILAFFFWAGAQ